jgi:putative redox protein
MLQCFSKYKYFLCSAQKIYFGNLFNIFQRLNKVDWQYFRRERKNSTHRWCNAKFTVPENSMNPLRMHHPKSQYSKGENMECTVKWMGSDNGMSFIGETGSGHMLAMDGAPEAGGRNLAPRPMELLLAGAGGCTAFDVVLILKKGRHAVTGCDVTLQAERAELDPKVFTKIHFDFTVKGKDLKPDAVERAIQLSKEKYCSASIMLGKTAEISHSTKIVQDGSK